MYPKPTIPMPAGITIGAKYGYAMTIHDQAEADAYLEACIEESMTHWGKTHEEAERIERGNLGYYAGYYDFETPVRIEKLFGGIHPIFGSTALGAPTDEQTFEIGKALGETAQRES